jgi:hypothetical protein
MKPSTLKGLHLRNVRQGSADFADDADQREDDLKRLEQFTECEPKPDLFFFICEIGGICGCLLPKLGAKRCATLSG